MKTVCCCALYLVCLLLLQTSKNHSLSFVAFCNLHFFFFFIPSLLNCWARSMHTCSIVLFCFCLVYFFEAIVFEICVFPNYAIPEVFMPGQKSTVNTKEHKPSIWIAVEKIRRLRISINCTSRVIVYKAKTHYFSSVDSSDFFAIEWIFWTFLLFSRAR